MTATDPDQPGLESGFLCHLANHQINQAHQSALADRAKMTPAKMLPVIESRTLTMARKRTRSSMALWILRLHPANSQNRAEKDHCDLLNLETKNITVIFLDRFGGAWGCG